MGHNYYLDRLGMGAPVDPIQHFCLGVEFQGFASGTGLEARGLSELPA